MRPEARAPLFDILQACERITRFTQGKTESDYASDDFVRSAVERQLSIAGEALVRLRQIERELAEGISEWRPIIAFRDRLIHGYETILDSVIWGIVERDVPTLAAEVGALLAAENGEEKS